MELTCTQLWCVQSYFDTFGYSEAKKYNEQQLS